MKLTASDIDTMIGEARHRIADNEYKISDLQYEIDDLEAAIIIDEIEINRLEDEMDQLVGK